METRIAENVRASEKILPARAAAHHGDGGFLRRFGGRAAGIQNETNGRGKESDSHDVSGNASKKAAASEDGVH